jgi:hypothetical protein
MIVIPSILNSAGDFEPERSLTDMERPTVISLWFFNGAYRYFQIGEESDVAAREDALRLVLNDTRSLNNTQWDENIALIQQLQQLHGDNYLEQYIAIQHPGQEIFS